jgi:hypothetical protein
MFKAPRSASVSRCNVPYTYIPCVYRHTAPAEIHCVMLQDHVGRYISVSRQKPVPVYNPVRRQTDSWPALPSIHACVRNIQRVPTEPGTSSSPVRQQDSCTLIHFCASTGFLSPATALQHAIYVAADRIPVHRYISVRRYIPVTSCASTALCCDTLDL